jgi:hypothetical protein
MLSRLFKRIFKKEAVPQSRAGGRYALSGRLSSYYLEQFREESAQITPYRAAGIYRLEDDEWVRVEKGGIHFPESPEQWTHTIDADGYQFDICFEGTGSAIDNGMIETVRSVLANIVEMDTAARAIPSKTDYEEQLHYVQIRAEDVELHYCSTIINTEWGAYFKRDANGVWIFEGLG